MWYKDYVKLRPLQKATFSIQPSEELVDEGGTQSYEHVDGCNPEWCQGRADQHEEPFPDEDRLQADDALPTWWHSGEDGGFETAGRSW